MSIPDYQKSGISGKPRIKPSREVSSNPVPRPKMSPDTLLKRKMWGDLHSFAARYVYQNPTAEQVIDAERWLLRWVERLPAGCPCRPEWEDTVACCPPPLTEGRMEFFWWTVAAHDRVNMLMRKPLWAKRSRNHPLLTSLVKSNPDYTIHLRKKIANVF